MQVRITELIKDESGISVVEYSIMLALIGAGILAATLGMGEQMTENINSATDGIAGGS